MAVTPDRFELPLVVCDTAIELANRFGVSINSVKSAILKNQSGKARGAKFIKVEIKEKSTHGTAIPVGCKLK